jgi:hypothetical protein
MTEPLDLDELERILQRATPGPWRSYSNGDVVGPEGTSLFIQRAYAAESGTETLPVFIQPADALLLEVARNDLPSLLARVRAAEARGAALEAAARAIVADCRVPRGDYLGDMCRWCDNTIDRDGHRPGCPVGVLESALETES